MSIDNVIIPTTSLTKVPMTPIMTTFQTILKELLPLHNLLEVSPVGLRASKKQVIFPLIPLLTIFSIQIPMVFRTMPAMSVEAQTLVCLQDVGRSRILILRNQKGLSGVEVERYFDLAFLSQQAWTKSVPVDQANTNEDPCVHLLTVD